MKEYSLGRTWQLLSKIFNRQLGCLAHYSSPGPELEILINTLFFFFFFDEIVPRTQGL